MVERFCESCFSFTDYVEYLCRLVTTKNKTHYGNFRYMKKKTIIDFLGSISKLNLYYSAGVYITKKLNNNK